MVADARDSGTRVQRNRQRTRQEKADRTGKRAQQTVVRGNAVDDTCHNRKRKCPEIYGLICRLCEGVGPTIGDALNAPRVCEVGAPGLRDGIGSADWVFCCRGCRPDRREQVASCVAVRWQPRRWQVLVVRGVDVLVRQDAACERRAAVSCLLEWVAGGGDCARLRCCA